jgi:hypothetical protein
MWNFDFDGGYAANKEKSNPVGLLRSLRCVDKKMPLIKHHLFHKNLYDTLKKAFLKILI